MVNDPVADMFSQLKNAGLGQKRQAVLPYSKLKLAILKLLTDQGYLKSVAKRQRKNKIYLHCELEFEGDQPKLTAIRRVSKPSRRVYARADDLRPVRGGTGLAIVSTSAGIMTAEAARRKKLGGELLARVW